MLRAFCNSVVNLALSDYGVRRLVCDDSVGFYYGHHSRYYVRKLDVPEILQCNIADTIATLLRDLSLEFSFLGKVRRTCLAKRLNIERTAKCFGHLSIFLRGQLA